MLARPSIIISRSILHSLTFFEGYITELGLYVYNGIYTDKADCIRYILSTYKILH